MSSADNRSLDRVIGRFAEVFGKIYDTGYMEEIVDLFQGECKVLLYLCAADGTVYPSDISRDLQISRQRATSVLSAMEKKGFVSLERDADDKRRVNVKILPKGEEIVIAKQDKIEHYFKTFIDIMGEKQILFLLNSTEIAIDAFARAEQSAMAAKDKQSKKPANSANAQDKECV